MISPSTVRRYTWLGISTGLMGRLLGLEVLVEGTVQKVGERLTVTARLVDVHTGKLIWAENYDYPAADWGQMQAEAAREGGRASGRASGHPRTVPAVRSLRSVREEFAQGFRRETEAPFAARWADAGAERSAIP